MFFQSENNNIIKNLWTLQVAFKNSEKWSPPLYRLQGALLHFTNLDKTKLAPYKNVNFGGTENAPTKRQIDERNFTQCRLKIHNEDQTHC